MHSLHKQLQSIASLSSTEWQLIEEKVIFKPLLKGQFLPNSSSKQLIYFVKSGLLKNNNNLIHKNNLFFISNISQENNSSINKSFEALENTELWQICYQDALNLIHIPAWKLFLQINNISLFNNFISFRDNPQFYNCNNNFQIKKAI